MRTTGTGPSLGVLAGRALVPLLLAGVLPAAARIPQPVSPGARSAGALVEARCPTFSWAGGPEARGYQIAVFRVSADPGAEPVLVSRDSVPGDARSFTPAVGQCLERGQRYAWSVAAVAGQERHAGQAEGQLDWAPALLFEVESVPSANELEEAVATIQRYLESGRTGATPPRGDTPTQGPPPAIDDARAEAHATQTRLRLKVSAPALDAVPPGALVAPTTAIRTASAVSTPTLGDASLTVTQQIHLATASAVFKDDSIFLWDDDDENTALGRNALASVTTATRNTAFGREALRYTTGGGTSSAGSYNTAVGNGALRSNTTGNLNTASGINALRTNTSGKGNTASGALALFSNTTGFDNTANGVSALVNNSSGARNTASGFNALHFNNTGLANTASGAYALRYNTTGERNVALGYKAGRNNTTGSDSIFIGNPGLAADTETIKIGTEGTQTTTFIAGIRGTTTGKDGAIAVLIDENGQLGTASSSRSLKQDIEDLGPLADRLLDLRPVAFRYRQHAAADPDTPLQFGLIAEEVAEVFPELVVFDENGKPETIKYHLLSSLLLGELQRLHGELSDQRQLVTRQQAELQRLSARQRLELQQLGDRLEALESGATRGIRRRGDDPERGQR